MGRRTGCFALWACAAGVAARVVAGCSTFGEDEQTPATDAGGSVDVVSNDASTGEDARSEGAAPYCRDRDATLCFDFPREPATLGWEGTSYDVDGSALSWTDAGMSEPGGARFSVGPLPLSGNTQRIQLTRHTPTVAAFTRMRFEIAVRIDATPDLGRNAIVRLVVGNALFYIYQSQTGWTLVHGYYAPICTADGGGPCSGATIDGTKLPSKLGTWDRLSITLEAGDAGTFRGAFDASNGEHIDFNVPAGFTPQLVPTNYLQVGFTDTSPADASRIFYVDDVSLTVQ